MLFTNETENAVSRVIAGTRYSCEPGGVVEIPDKVAFEVALVGMKLIPLDEATRPLREGALEELDQKPATQEPVAATGPKPRPCIEEFVAAGYKATEYDSFFSDPEWGPSWSDPNWQPLAPGTGETTEAKSEPKAAPKPSKAPAKK